MLLSRAARNFSGELLRSLNQITILRTSYYGLYTHHILTETLNLKYPYHGNLNLNSLAATQCLGLSTRSGIS